MRSYLLTNTAGDILTAVGMLVLIILVFVCAYFATKLLGKKNFFRQGVSAGKNIKVLEQIPLGQDRSLVIIQTAGMTLLLGVTSQHVELLKELDAEQFQTEEESQPPAAPFSTVFQDALKSWKLSPKGSKEKKDKKEGPHL